MEGILAITFIFGGGSVFLLAISPVGRAIAQRIQGGRGADESEEALRELETSQHAVLDEVDALRREVVEMQERLDFAERLLAQQRQGALPPSEMDSGGT